MCFYGKIMLRTKLKMQHIMEKKVIAGEKSKKSRSISEKAEIKG